MLKQTEVEFFKSQGYLLMQDVLTAEQLARLRDIAEAERARARTAARTENDILETKAYGNEPEVFRLSRVMARHEEFRAVAIHPRVCAAVRELLGGDAEVCINRHNMMLVKAARVGRQVDWHQDGWNWNNDGMISFMVFLDDATPQNGCLEIIPGAHKNGLLPCAQSGVGRGMDLARPEIAALVRQAVPVPVKAGDGLFFHSCLPHFSKANTSEFSRRNLVFAYVSANGKQGLMGSAPIESIPLPNENYCPSALSSTVA
ncbi:MAG TPA: phytanoyl-CoA dioxygenase family protein [Planctomycetota bacterium]|nr:phytanoyl-CoA dioxygenase family protein [Planctomycetota bacterium]